MRLKKSCVAIGTLCFMSISPLAGASISDTDIKGGLLPKGDGEGSVNENGYKEGQRLILTQQHAFYVLKTFVPVTEQPNAAQAGQWVILPAGASIDIIEDAEASREYGSTVRIAPFDVEADSEVPGDFVVSSADLRTAQAQNVVPNILDAQIEQEEGASQETALLLDQQESQIDGYFSQEARRGHGGGGQHKGRGGGRRKGMTYCLQNVENRAVRMGVCPHKISEGYARKAIPGFVSKCGMRRVAYSPDLPLGSVCASQGTSRHFCAGARCGDIKIKVGANTWSNGVGRDNSQHAIGFTYGCAAPRQ